MSKLYDTTISVNLKDRISGEDKAYMDRVGFEPTLFELCVNTLLGALGAVTQGDIRLQRILVDEVVYVMGEVSKAVPRSADMPPPDSKAWKK